MKVLITGGAGFIGSHLADRLLARGDEVLVDRQLRHRAARQPEPRTSLDGRRRLDRRRATRRRGVLRRLRPDVVVHAAASYKDPDNWEEDAATNVLGTANVVRPRERAASGGYLLPDRALLRPPPARAADHARHPLRPEGELRDQKTAGEHYVALSELDWISFRLANAYGPRIQRPAADVLPAADEGSRAS